MFSSGETGFASWLKKAWLKSGCCAWNSKQWGLRGLQVPGEVPSTAPEKTTSLAQLSSCLWQTSHQPASSSAVGSSLYRNGNQHLTIMTDTLRGLLINMASYKSALYHGGKGKRWSWQVLSLRCRALWQLHSHWQFLSCRMVSSQPASFTGKGNWIETCRKQARITEKRRKSWFSTYWGGRKSQ